MYAPTRTAKFRAALLAVVIGSQLLLALPVPHKVTDSKLNRPEAKEELNQWMGVIRALGLPLKREQVRELVITTTTTLSKGHRKLIWPLRPFMTTFGINQGWALFASPDSYPSRLVVEAHIDGEWQTVFRRLDPEHTLLARKIGFRRVRGVYDSASRTTPSFRNFAEWIARGVFEAHPTASEVRVKMIRTHTTVPHEPPDPKTITRIDLRITPDQARP